MARVERRMYRWRQKRARRRRRVLALLLAASAVAVLLAWGRKPVFQAERIAAPTATPVASAYDQTIETREITLPEETWYAIQTGVFSTAEAAAEKAGAYAERGAPGTVVRDGAKWRVFIACYGSESDAASVRQRLGDTQQVETYLYHWNCDELRLRLTGMAGQLDVVEAGFSLLQQTAAALRDAATLLDAGELTATEACQTVGEIDGRITLWAQTARSRFRTQQPDVIKQLLALTDGWNARRKSLEGAADSATALSAELKGQGMAMFSEVIALRQGIAAQ